MAHTTHMDPSVISLETAIAGALAAVIILGYLFYSGMPGGNEASWLAFDTPQTLPLGPK